MSAYYSEFDPQAAAWLRELIKAGHLPPGDVDERDIRDVVPADLAGYRQHHFFCGAGGWPYALRLAGWPDDRPVWTGSCPCQPFSSAGKRKGVGDERHLWPDFFRLIEACRPPVVFGEQVASSEVVGTELEAAFVVAVRRGDHARANRLAKRLAQSGSFHFHRRWLDGVRADLEGAGYAFGSSVLGAHSAGAPHIRQRLYWVADAGPQRRERRAGAGRPVGKATTERCQGVPDAERSGDAGPALGVFHPESHGREQRRAGSGGRGTAGGCGVGRLGDAISEHLRGHARNSFGTQAGGPEGGQVDGLGCVQPERPSAFCGVGVAQGDANQPGPQGRGVSDGERAGERAVGPAGGDAGFWSAFDLIPCRDGKWRRVPAGCFEPGVQRVADGLSAGVAGVRGEGDADYPPGFPLTRKKVAGRVGLLRGYGNAIVPQVAAVFVRAWLGVTGEG